jgi:hypothetical protein
VYITAIDPAQFLQRLLERGEASPCFRIARNEREEHANAPHGFRLLRARRERPNCRATE